MQCVMPFTEIKSQTSLIKLETSCTEKSHISVTKKRQLVPSQTSFLARQSPILTDDFKQCRTSAHGILVTQSEPRRCRRAKLTVAESSSLHRMISPVCTSKSYFLPEPKISVLYGEQLLRFHQFCKTYNALTTLL